MVVPIGRGQGLDQPIDGDWIWVERPSGPRQRAHSGVEAAIGVVPETAPLAVVADEERYLNATSNQAQGNPTRFHGAPVEDRDDSSIPRVQQVGESGTVRWSGDVRRSESTNGFVKAYQ